MSNQVCEVCGKELTKWNHAWGTAKCSRCAKGRSPEAKLHKQKQDVQKHLELFPSLDAILQPSISTFFLKSGLLMLVVNAAALGSHIAADTTKNSNFYLAEILVFVVGVNVGTHLFFARSTLLDVKRWRAFWRFNIGGYLLGFVLFFFIAANSRALHKAHDTSPSRTEANAVLLSIILPAVVGVVLAIFFVAITDKKRIAWVTAKWNELHPQNASSENQSTQTHLSK